MTTAKDILKYSEITNMVTIVDNMKTAAEMLSKQKSMKAKLLSESLLHSVWMLHVQYPEAFRTQCPDVAPLSPLHEEIWRKEEEELQRKYPEWYAEREARKNKKGATA